MILSLSIYSLPAKLFLILSNGTTFRRSSDNMAGPNRKSMLLQIPNVWLYAATDTVNRNTNADYTFPFPGLHAKFSYHDELNLLHSARHFTNFDPTISCLTVEVIRFGFYLFFPVAMMVKFGDPEWYNSYVVPYGQKLFPDFEKTNVSPRRKLVQVQLQKARGDGLLYSGADRGESQEGWTHHSPVSPLLRWKRAPIRRN